MIVCALQHTSFGYLLYSLHPLNWQGVVEGCGRVFSPSDARKEVGRGGVLRWFLCWFPLCVAVAAAFAAVDVATAAVVVAFAFADVADVAVVAVVAFAFAVVAVVAVVAAVAVLALLLLEEVRFVRTGDGLGTTQINLGRIMMINENENK